MVEQQLKEQQNTISKNGASKTTLLRQRTQFARQGLKLTEILCGQRIS